MFSLQLRLCVKRNEILRAEKEICATFLDGFFSKDPATNLAIMMGDWMAMAEVVGRKLVQNGQERILQRIFDGLNSNFVLETADFKESHQHKLLHLVWRKFPRNKCSTEGLKTTISDSTQTEDDIIRPGLLKNSRDYVTSNTDCFSGTDMKGLFDMDESASSSDSGSFFDYSLSADMVAREGASLGSSFPSTDLVAQEKEPFQFPVKGRSSKPRTFMTKTQTELSNRYICLKDVVQTDDDPWEEIGRKSPKIGSVPKSNQIKPYQTTPALSSGLEPSVLKSSSDSPSNEVTQFMKEVNPGCSKEAEGNRREEGTVIKLDSRRNSPNFLCGSIAPDIFSPGRDPGSLWFKKDFLHSANDYGIKQGDKVSYFYQQRGGTHSLMASMYHVAKDIRVIDNG